MSKEFWQGFRSGCAFAGALLCWPFSARARLVVREFRFWSTSSPSRLSTVEAIADDVLERLAPGDRAWLEKCTREAARAMHHGFGTWIRNHYRLWGEGDGRSAHNALTHRWRTDPTSHVIKDGVDCSEDHPDAMSDAIIQRVWEKLHEKGKGTAGWLGDLRCTGCGNVIDPDTCGCGSPITHSAMDAGHAPVPMGCDCMRSPAA